MTRDEYRRLIALAESAEAAVRGAQHAVTEVWLAIDDLRRESRLPAEDGEES